MVQFTVEKDINTMLLGTEPLAAIAALDPLPIDVLGMNCATGPDDMREHVRTLSRASSRLPISVIPNAGIPYLEDGADRLPAHPEALAAAHVEFVAELGVPSSAAAAARPPSTWPRSSTRSATLVPRPRVSIGPRSPGPARPAH
jgi:5-methyltetrahydrofolate--homocysteine methyltransferase